MPHSCHRARLRKMFLKLAASVAVFLLLALDAPLTCAQEAAYYWSEETTTSFSNELTTDPAASQPRSHTNTLFDAELIPVFVVTTEICNSPRAVVFQLEATGQNITYTIVKATFGKNLLAIDDKQRVILQDKANFSQTEIVISAKKKQLEDDASDPLTAIHPAASFFSSQHENYLFIKASISDSQCPGSEGSSATVVIVCLSVLCIVFLSALSLSLIALRRKKPFLFSSKHDKLAKNTSQVGPSPGDHSTGEQSRNARPEAPDHPKSYLITNSTSKPQKSSLKTSKRLPEVPEVSITCDSPSPSASSPFPAFNNEAFSEGSESDFSDQALHEMDRNDQNVSVVHTLNGIMALNPLSSVSGSPEKRRPSTVTFNERTQIIEIARKKK